MSSTAPYPRLRTDLTWYEIKQPGPVARYLVRDPRQGDVIALSAKERFLCLRLNGETPPDQLAHDFAEAFGQTLRLSQLAAMLRQLSDQGLLEQVAPAHPHSALATWKPLPIAADRWFHRLARFFAWTYTVPGRIGYWLYLSLGLWACFATRDAWWPVLRNLDDLIDWVSLPGVWSWDRMLIVLAVALVLPLLKELPKGITCRHFGARVPHLWFGRILHIIPRITPDLTEVRHLDREVALRVVSAGLRCELLLFVTGVMGSLVLRDDNPMYQVMVVLAAVSAIRLAFDANPLGRQDGRVWWAVRAGIADYRQRSVRMFRAWFLGQTYPEPMAPARRRSFIRYGALAELYSWVVRVIVIGLLGYILIRKLGGFGVLMLAVGLLLRYHEDILHTVRGLAPGRHAGRWRAWRWGAVGVHLGLALLLAGGIAWGIFRPSPWVARARFEVQPAQEILVRSRIHSQVVSMAVKPGDEVEAGQTVAHLDRRHLERDLDQARSALHRTRAILDAAMNGTSEARLAVFEQAVQLSNTAVDYSERTVQRYQELRARARVTGQTLHAAERHRDEAAAIRDLVMAGRDQADAGTPPERIAALQADVDALQGVVAYLAERLAHTRVVAPVAGRVVWVRKQGSPGIRVGPGDVLARVEGPGTHRLRLVLPEAHAASIQVGARVAGRAWAYPDTQLEGRVVRVVPLAVDGDDDARRRSVSRQGPRRLAGEAGAPGRFIPVDVELDPPGVTLRTGMTGRVRIAGTAGSHAPPVPSMVLRFLRVEGWFWIP